jgi:hypothetical protein
MIIPYVSSTACDNGEDDALPEMKYSQLNDIDHEFEITEAFENKCFELISEYLSYEDTHFFYKSVQSIELKHPDAILTLDQTLEIIDKDKTLKSKFQQCVLDTAGAYPPDDIDDVFSVSYYCMEKWNHWLITDNLDNLCRRCFKEYLTNEYQGDKDERKNQTDNNTKEDDNDEDDEDDEDEDDEDEEEDW